VRIHPPFPPCLLPWDCCLINNIFSSPLKLPILYPYPSPSSSVHRDSLLFWPQRRLSLHDIRTPYVPSPAPSTEHPAPHQQQQRPTSPFSVSLRLDSGDRGTLSRTFLERLIPRLSPLPALRVTAPSFYVLRSTFYVLRSAFCVYRLPRPSSPRSQPPYLTLAALALVPPYPYRTSPLLLHVCYWSSHAHLWLICCDYPCP
jgi:hypothetical protein